MSGIVGIFNFDDAPVAPQLLWRMTEYMAFRAPDAQETWIDGGSGLGHTMLRTTDESLRERQPFSLDNNVWIVADARVDGRDDLIHQLEARGHGELKNATDVELILRAYHAWGEDCVNHLIGDFAFAVWDKRRWSLFCGRDHFGIKPFYYAQARDCLIISNTLNCIRLHPAISDRLNEQAVGDFLLWESNEDPETTFFAGIRRLPAAHTLTWSNGNLRTRRYWAMPIEDEIRYRRESDYVEHFVGLFDEAVNDRLRTDRVGMFMSGGMDSTTIAATANKLLTRKNTPYDLRAFTIVYDRLIPDEERRYSGMAAKFLGIPIHYIAVDDYRLYERYDEPELHKPEPAHFPLAAMAVDQYRQVAAHARVTLTGQGGDAVLRGSFSYLTNLFKTLQFGRAAMEVGKHVITHRNLPQIGLRTRVRRWLKRPSWKPSYPDWLNPDFETRLDLPERWEQLLAEQPHIHPRRPEAYQILTTLFWTQLFESYDPEVTNFPIETRHPLFDLRLLSYLMALPTLPVCVDKRLMRMAMRGMLPEQVLSRRKAPLTGDPLVEVMRRNGFYTKNPLRLAPELAAYVRFDWIPRLTDTTQGADQLWANLRVLSLNYWLCGLIRTSSKSTFLKGDVYGTEEATPQERISTPSTDCLR